VLDENENLYTEMKAAKLVLVNLFKQNLKIFSAERIKHFDQIK
jgi:hypothetical protein